MLKKLKRRHNKLENSKVVGSRVEDSKADLNNKNRQLLHKKLLFSNNKEVQEWKKLGALLHQVIVNGQQQMFLINKIFQ